MSNIKIKNNNSFSISFITYLMIANVGILGSIRQAQSAEREIKSSFKACEAVRIISEDEYNSNKRKWDQEKKTCGDRLQISPNAGFTGQDLDRLSASSDTLMLTQLVAEKAKQNLDQNITHLKKMQSCFSENARTEECKLNRTKVKKDLAAAIPQLRQALALSSYNLESIGASGEKLDLSIDNANLSLDMFDTLFSATNSNPLKGSKLTATERAAVIEAIQQKDAEFAKAYENEFNQKFIRKGSTGLLKKAQQAMESLIPNEATAHKKQFYSEKIKEMTTEHQQNYRRIVFQQAPLLAYLPTAQFNSNGKASWTDSDIHDAYSKLIENAEREHEIASNTLKSGKLDFSSTNAQGAGSLAKRLYKSVIQGERDLLDYMAFTPIVDEVLKEHPQYCGLATGLVDNLHTRSSRLAGSSLVLMLPAFALGAPVAAAGLQAASGVALTGAEAGALLGAATGMGFVFESGAELSRQRGSVLTHSGSDQERITQDFKKIEEAEDNVAMNLLFHPLDYIGVGGAIGKLMQIGAKNHILPPHITKLLATVKPGSKEEAKIINQAIADIVFKGKSPSETETKLLDQFTRTMAEKGFFSNAQDSDIVRKQALKRYFDIARRVMDKPIKSKQDELVAKKMMDLFLNLDADAMKRWSDDGFAGLLRVYDITRKDMAKMSQKEIAALDQAGHEQIFRKALREAGASESQQSKLAGCALRGSRVASLSDEFGTSNQLVASCDLPRAETPYYYRLSVY